MHQLSPLSPSRLTRIPIPQDDLSVRHPLHVLLAALFLLLSTTIAFAGDENSKKDGSRMQSTLEVRAMKKVRKAIDDVARQQAGFIDNVLKDMGEFVGDFEQIGKDVAEKTNAWIEDPTEKRRAQLTRAVSEGAARGQRACGHLSKSDAKVAELVGVIRGGLAAHVKEARALAQGARHRVQGYKRQVDEARKAAIELREELARRNLLDGGELPMEIEDRLWHLKIDFEDAQVMSELSEGTAIESENFVGRLKDIDTDYEAIERMVGRIAYRARSAKGIFAGIGELEKAGIYNRLIADAYDSRGMREQMLKTFERMQSMQGSLGALRIGISKRYSSTKARVNSSRVPIEPSGGNLRAWLSGLGSSPKSAPATPQTAPAAPKTSTPPSPLTAANGR